jgi:hypothetical protein
MVSVSATSDFLLADARADLRRRASEDGRTELSRAFAAWLLRENDGELASLVSEAATREGAQQDFHTAAILGFGAEAGLLTAEAIEALKKGLRRQSGRGVVIDELPAAFCSDAVGILGVVLGTKAVADPELTDQIVKWVSKFLKKSYDEERTEDWQRCLFATADRQLGSSLDLTILRSPATADVRTALVSKDLIDASDAESADQDGQQTLTLAMRELANDLPSDRAALRLAAIQSVIETIIPVVNGNNTPRATKSGSLSDRDARVHEVIGQERFRTLRNAEIMRDPTVKKRLRVDFELEAGRDDTKSCLDRIRAAKEYPLSRQIVKKRSHPQ